MNRYDIALGKPLVLTGRMRREQEDRQDPRNIKELGPAHRSRVKTKTASLSVIGNLDWVANQLGQLPTPTCKCESGLVPKPVGLLQEQKGD